MAHRPLGQVAVTTDTIIDRLNIDNGNTYHTEEECKAHERKLAEIQTLQRQHLELNFEGVKMAGWVVGYNYHLEELVYADAGYVNYGRQLRYATEERLKVY